MSAETEANIMPLVEIASPSQTCMAVVFKEVNFLRKLPNRDFLAMLKERKIQRQKVVLSAINMHR